MTSTERHLTNARAELSGAHFASLKEHDRETSLNVQQLMTATETVLELLKRKRERHNHPG